MTRNRRLIGLLFAGTVAVGLAGLPAHAVAVSPPVQVNSDADPAHSHIWPNLAMDPADPQHLVLADINRLGRAALGPRSSGLCEVFVSWDGGRSWGAPTVLAVPSGMVCRRVQPKVSFAADGAVIVLYVAVPTETDPVNGACGSVPVLGACGVSSYADPFFDVGAYGASRYTLLVARSTDGGVSFGDPVEVPLSPAERLVQSLGGGAGAYYYAGSGYHALYHGAQIGGAARGTAMTTDGGSTVYVAWNGSGSHREAVWLSKSTDGGRTFSEPKAIPAPLTRHPLGVNPYGVYRMSLSVLRERVVMAVAWLSCGPITDCVDTSGGPWWFTTYVQTSTDAGESFPSSSIVAQYPVYDYSGDAVPPAPGLAVDPNVPARVYVTYEDQIEGDVNKNAYLVRTLNGGVTWLPPLRIGDDAYDNVTPHERPTLSIAPNGRLDVAWYDGRYDPTSSAPDCPPDATMCGGRDVLYSYSTDRGTTLSPHIRLTPATFSARTRRIESTNPFGQEALSSIGLVSTNAGVVAAWEQSGPSFEVPVDGGTRQGTSWDIKAARVTM